jgi:hypothetical protein
MELLAVLASPAIIHGSVPHFGLSGRLWCGQWFLRLNI